MIRFTLTRTRRRKMVGNTAGRDFVAEVVRLRTCPTCRNCPEFSRIRLPYRPHPRSCAVVLGTDWQRYEVASNRCMDWMTADRPVLLPLTPHQMPHDLGRQHAPRTVRLNEFHAGETHLS